MNNARFQEPGLQVYEDLWNQQVSPSPRPQQLVAMIGERKTLFCARHHRREQVVFFYCGLFRS
jgi:hypothetical protein